MLMPSLLMFLPHAIISSGCRASYIISLWARSWCRHGRRWEKYKLKQLKSVRLWIQRGPRSGSWFKLAPMMRGK